MKKYKVSDIVWEVFDEDHPLEPGDLPLKVVIEVNDDFDPAEEIADYLSDDYGWCVESCSFEGVKG
ncbi:hypothetical protein LCGC14_2594840 [marine sediment metagenome]|uniref:Uncharacterized protein n=1 Tax=marine sediment metagenome TaxID=412755 RepID=A0A0F9CLJ3_9ZZZZ